MARRPYIIRFIDFIRWKAATPEQLAGAHLYLDIAKSGYLFHGYSRGICNRSTFSSPAY